VRLLTQHFAELCMKLKLTISNFEWWIFNFDWGEIIM